MSIPQYSPETNLLGNSGVPYLVDCFCGVEDDFLDRNDVSNRKNHDEFHYEHSENKC